MHINHFFLYLIITSPPPPIWSFLRLPLQTLRLSCIPPLLSCVSFLPLGLRNMQHRRAPVLEYRIPVGYRFRLRETGIRFDHCARNCLLIPYASEAACIDDDIFRVRVAAGAAGRIRTYTRVGIPFVAVVQPGDAPHTAAAVAAAAAAGHKLTLAAYIPFLLSPAVSVLPAAEGATMAPLRPRIVAPHLRLSTVLREAYPR